MFEIFIRRPILSGVISVVIVFLGLLAITSLPITQFPDIVPPSVTVTARYTGANADVMAKTVATPLERAINGVPGMTYMTTGQNRASDEYFKHTAYLLFSTSSDNSNCLRTVSASTISGVITIPSLTCWTPS